MKNTKNEDKEFDRSICFTFYNAYYEYISFLEEELGKEIAYDVYKAICEYGLFQKPIPRHLMIYVNQVITYQIDSSQERRERQFGGNKENLDQSRKILEVYMEHPDWSQNRIATDTGISKYKVNKVIKKYKANEYNGILIIDGELVADDYNDNCNDNGNGNYNGRYRYRYREESDSDISEGGGSPEPDVAAEAAPDVADAPDSASLHTTELPEEIQNLKFDSPIVSDDVVIYSLKNYCTYHDHNDIDTFREEVLDYFERQKCNLDSINTYVDWYLENK